MVNRIKTNVLAFYRKRICIGTILLLALAQPACTAGGIASSTVQPIKAGTRVRVSTISPTVEMVELPKASRSSIEASTEEAILGGPSRRKSVPEGATEGAVVGAAAGASAGLGLSLLCGPAFAYCAAIWAAPMAATGAAAGAVGGAYGAVDVPVEPVVFDATKRSDSGATVIDFNFGELQASLKNEIIRGSNNVWEISDEEPQVEVFVGLEAVHLNRLDNGDLIVVTHASLRVTGSGFLGSATYSSSSSGMSAEQWIEDNGSLLRNAIETGIQKNARQMVWALRPVQSSEMP